MKKITLLLLVLILGCTNKPDQLIPTFKSNKQLEDITDAIRNIIAQKEFSVVCYHPGDGIEFGFKAKLLCRANGIWEKIEIIDGINEVDNSSKDSFDFVSKGILLRKECKKEEGEVFLKKLVDFGLFKLSEEEELLKECKKTRSDQSIPKYSDAGRIIFYISLGDEVRSLSYGAFYHRKEDCPSQSKEWDAINDIDSLFEKEWYLKKHY